MDVRLHPDYENNGWLYLAYATTGEGGSAQGGNTAIMRARLKENRLTDKQLLFKGLPDTRAGVHFGTRMVFDNDGYLYFSIGDRGHMPNAQTLSNHAGKIHRIKDDGGIPADNPFVDTPDAMPTIWSYGHRNPQGLVKHPQTGALWSHEHGPRGGDEINLIQTGLNYGWPEISYGINYDGTIITEDTTKAGLKGFCPRPPKDIFPMPMAMAAPMMMSPKGMLVGRLNASRSPVTAAEPSMMVLCFLSRYF